MQTHKTNHKCLYRRCCKNDKMDKEDHEKHCDVGSFFKVKTKTRNIPGFPRFPVCLFVMKWITVRGEWRYCKIRGYCQGDLFTADACTWYFLLSKRVPLLKSAGGGLFSADAWTCYFYLAAWHLWSAWEIPTTERKFIVRLGIRVYAFIYFFYIQI